MPLNIQTTRLIQTRVKQYLNLELFSLSAISRGHLVIGTHSQGQTIVKIVIFRAIC
jgi:hypothetical protein